MEVYRHQVGGHSKFMKPQDSSKVYKPFSESEFRFYEKLSTLGLTATDSGPLHILKQFVPKYYGVTEVQVQTTVLPPIIHLPGGSQTSDDDLKSKEVQLQTAEIFCENNRAHKVLKYLVLEDLVYQYKKPCVMDVKMGKRQRKIGASPEKEERQLEKSLKTTSHAVGFRLCGCQFYDIKNDTLCYRDKYWGRKLTKEKLPQAVSQWFWNGYITYHELVAPLIKRLQILYACISKLKHYRFWSSSLLWVFDGGSIDSTARVRSLDVRMIDFANTIILKDDPSPDEDYLYGLGNLIKILEAIAFINSSGMIIPNSVKDYRYITTTSQQPSFVDKGGIADRPPSTTDQSTHQQHTEHPKNERKKSRQFITNKLQQDSMSSSSGVLEWVKQQNYSTDNNMFHHEDDQDSKKNNALLTNLLLSSHENNQYSLKKKRRHSTRRLDNNNNSQNRLRSHLGTETFFKRHSLGLSTSSPPPTRSSAYRSTTRLREDQMEQNGESLPKRTSDSDDFHSKSVHNNGTSSSQSNRSSPILPIIKSDTLQAAAADYSSLSPFSSPVNATPALPYHAFPGSSIFLPILSDKRARDLCSFYRHMDDGLPFKDVRKKKKKSQNFRFPFHWKVSDATKQTSGLFISTKMDLLKRRCVSVPSLHILDSPCPTITMKGAYHSYDKTQQRIASICSALEQPDDIEQQRFTRRAGNALGAFTVPRDASQWQADESDESQISISDDVENEGDVDSDIESHRKQRERDKQKG